ncbi:MAG: ELM1/GtrOC1 family putative glycosyltransferase [Pseudomonadota bacterium]
MLVLSDGVAGHDRASDGIVRALGHKVPVRAHWLRMEEVRPRSRRLARLAAASLAPAPFLSRNVRLLPDGVAAPWADASVAGWPEAAHIVVSTGPSTAAANIAAARRYGARNIYYGFAKWPSVGFSLLLTPVAATGERMETVPRPSEVDLTDFPPPRPLAADAPRTIAMLLGGDTKHYAYTEADFAAMAERLAGLLDTCPDWHLSVFDSRRTPQAPFAAMQKSLAGHARVSLHPFRTGGVNSNRAAFEADAVIVTADSLSMVSECIAAGRPTMVVKTATYRGPKRDRGELAGLAAANVIAMADVDGLDVAGLSAAPRPQRGEPARVLLDALARHGF